VGLANEPKALLFQTYSRATGRLTGNPLPQANAYAMIQRRAKAARASPRAPGNHAFRATGVTAYLKNGGTLEQAAQMANHASICRHHPAPHRSREEHEPVLSACVRLTRWINP
jgi:hypothetical protein